LQLQRNQLDRWLNAVRGNAIAHDYLSNVYRGRSRLLTVTEVLLNAIVTSAIFSSTGGGGAYDAQSLQILAGVLSMLVSVLTGLKSALGYEQRYEQHHAAALRFSKLWTRFEDLHNLRQIPYSRRTDSTDDPSTILLVRTTEWNDWFKDYSDVMESAPLVDSWTWNKVKHGSHWEYSWLCRKLRSCFCWCIPRLVRKDEAELPDGWTEYFDEVSQLPYYHKRGEDTVTWIRPRTEDKPPPPPREEPPRRKLNASAASSAASPPGQVAMVARVMPTSSGALHLQDLSPPPSLCQNPPGQPSGSYSEAQVEELPEASPMQ